MYGASENKIINFRRNLNLSTFIDYFRIFQTLTDYFRLFMTFSDSFRLFLTIVRINNAYPIFDWNALLPYIYIYTQLVAAN